MRQTDSYKLALAGVVVAAVLASCLVLPAMSRLATFEGTWLAAAILGVPTAVVLFTTGYPHYGSGRSAAVALGVTTITLVASWVFSVLVVASALSGSTTTMATGVLLYGIPAAIVAVLGFAALRLVPGRPAAGNRLTFALTGNRAA
ncbi:hypothetical protein [Mycobacterium sp. E740]|uniref:hypothetical protein n=1 Tax=Mycobacterium sp. E740 TaxID=1834149 RepID=UPI0007FD1F42|nr:hypothetical protein [Mycobacterium sp. E740]OBI84641.1 hypothetical protein A5663_10925 [Mycobacterium sp. E740]